MKLNDQVTRDRQRQTYVLTFPANLDSKRVLAWLRSISGTLNSGTSRLNGVPTICFEMWATDKGITHRLKVPWQHADYVIGQLRSQVPGIRVAPEEVWPSHQWTRAVEIGQSNSSRSLRIMNVEDTAVSLLSAVQALKPDESVMMQWVVTPAVPERLPLASSRSNEFSWFNVLGSSAANKDEVDDRRSKLSEPNLLAVLRVAAVATTDDRADHLIYRLQAAFAATRTPYNRFVKRMVSKRKLQDRLTRAAGVLAFPMQLSISEMSALIAWPVGSPFVAGLPQGLARHLPAPESVPRIGRVLGQSNFPGNERAIAMSHLEACKHTYVVAPTGAGKSVLLANMLKQDMEQGYGAVVVESKGDLFNAALGYVPRDRINDVIVLDVNDTTHPVGFNVLAEGDPHLAIDGIEQIINRLYDDDKNVWTRELIYHGFHTLISKPGHTLIDIVPLLAPRTSEEGAWRDDLIRNLSNPELLNFWQRFDNQPKARQDQITAPLLSRFWNFNARPALRNILGQSTSGFSMADVVAKNKILLINVSGLDSMTTKLIGTMLINSLWNAVRQNPPDKPTFLYLDEFQNFMKLPIETGDMLAQARSFKLGMVLAHQHTGQLTPDVKNAVLANARTKLVFQTTQQDARLMAGEFGAAVDEHDFMHLSRYEAIARVATSEGVSEPITISTSAPARREGHEWQVRQASRAQHSRLVGEVEAEILARRSAVVEPRKRRPKAGLSWE